MIMQIDSINVTWIVKTDMVASFYRGEDIGISVQDSGEQVIRFSLRNVKDPGEDPFQAILTLQENEKRFYFQADCYDDPKEQYPLRLLRSDDREEMLLICDDEVEKIFFDITL